MYGVCGVLESSPDGLTVQCHVCGKWVRGLGHHGWMAHGLRADEYREQFGLMGKTGLVSQDAKQRYRDSGARNLVNVDRAARRRKLYEARMARITQPLPHRLRREEHKILVQAFTRTDEAWAAMSRKGVEANQRKSRQRQAQRVCPTCLWCQDAIQTVKKAYQNDFCSRACYIRSIQGKDTDALRRGRETLKSHRETMLVGGIK